jgi:radical SAM superfamily enzyme YgiQ (UPF0313 family)
MKVLLVSPKTPDTFWSFKHVLKFVSKKASIPPLGLLTVAAMLPHDWELRLVDMNVEPLQDADLLWADFVMISAMIVHKESVGNIGLRCATLGKRVIAGGPLFTTGYEAFPEIGHFVIGEAEQIIAQVVEDMRCDRLRRIYKSPGWPGLTQTPIPRWDLININNYVTMSVQFSRGCPFDCEFCDIIVINGRVPRTKTPPQLIAELEVLRLRGWKDMVFIVDDNFIGNKQRARELLRELIEWRKSTKAKMGFFTEASVNLADDAELCALMVEAGFNKVFVGIETPAAESIEECHKVQNRRDLVEAVHTLQRRGLEVMGGFIVGFDSDREDIFKRQFEFIQRSGVVTAMVGLLTALPQTRLYKRLEAEGRLESETTGNNTDSAINFKPKLNREFLQSGYRDLMKKLYEPNVYYQRVQTFFNNFKNMRGEHLRLSRADFMGFLKSFWLLGIWYRGRVAYWRFFWSALLLRPNQFRRAIEFAILGYHFRRVAREC